MKKNKIKTETNRDPSDIRKDLSYLINDNRLSSFDIKLRLMSHTYEIILNKKLFHNNNDLLPFINSIYYDGLNLDKYYKDYLFSSRTLLASRVLRDIYEKGEYSSIIKIIRELILFIDSYLNYDNKNLDEKDVKKNDNTRYILEWMKSIRGNQNDS